MTVADFVGQALRAALDGYPEMLSFDTHSWLVRQARSSKFADEGEAQRAVLAEVVRRCPLGVHAPDAGVRT